MGAAFSSGTPLTPGESATSKVENSEPCLGLWVIWVHHTDWATVHRQSMDTGDWDQRPEREAKAEGGGALLVGHRPVIAARLRWAEEGFQLPRKDDLGTALTKKFQSRSAF